MTPGGYQDLFKSVQNEALGGSGGISCTRPFQERVFGACNVLEFRSFAPTWALLGGILGAAGFAEPLNHFFIDIRIDINYKK